MAVIRIQNINKIEKAAEQFFEEVAKRNKKSDTPLHCFAFYGAMGVGKTTFIKALCNILDVVDVVTSPSFAIINEYHTKNGKQIFHFDFYRIEKISDTYQLGCEDYFFREDFCFIEWPEKIESILPEHCIPVLMQEELDEARIIKF